MNQPIEHDAYVEMLANGACRAQLLDLPGCFAIADDVAAAVALLEGRIPAYYEWLRAHDEFTPFVAGPFRVTARDVQQIVGSADAFFPPDAVPVSDEDLDWLLALLDWSLDDLLHLGERIPPSAHDMPTRVGPPANLLLRQAAEAQARYLVMLNTQPDPHAVTLSPAPPLEQLREARAVSLRRLRNVSTPDRTRVFEALGERWSLRKILRCGILSARSYAEPLAAAAGQ